MRNGRRQFFNLLLHPLSSIFVFFHNDEEMRRVLVVDHADQAIATSIPGDNFSGMDELETKIVVSGRSRRLNGADRKIVSVERFKRLLN